MKVVAIILSIILVASSFGLVVKYNKSANKALKRLEEARYSLITTEENLYKANRKISGLQLQISRLEGKIKTSEQMLEEASIINNDLRVRLDEVVRVKKNLEQRVNEFIELTGN